MCEQVSPQVSLSARGSDQRSINTTKTDVMDPVVH